MGGVELIIFAGGVGENGPETREEICKDMEWLGIELDHEKNNGLRSKEAVISKEGARVKVMVVPTNEELVIAEDTVKIINELNKKK